MCAPVLIASLYSQLQCVCAPVLIASLYSQLQCVCAPVLIASLYSQLQCVCAPVLIASLYSQLQCVCPCTNSLDFYMYHNGSDCFSNLAIPSPKHWSLLWVLISVVSGATNTCGGVQQLMIPIFLHSSSPDCVAVACIHSHFLVFLEPL